MREVSRQAVRRQIETVAMDLFLEQGFDETTVQQIAAAVGISARSFFRYFPTKEDLVVGDPAEFGVVLRDALEARPADEGAVAAMRGALEAFTAEVDANPAAMGISKVMLGTPSLRAKHIEKQQVWAELLAPDVRRRLAAAGRVEHDELVAEAVIGAALATFHATLGYWADRGGVDDLRHLLSLAWAVDDA